MNSNLRLGADSGVITTAERELGVVLPDELKANWQRVNGLELPGGWLFFPVFDPSNPRKTSNSIVYENTEGRGRCDRMADDLISIAGNGTGNHLVLKVRAGAAGSEVLHWDHERNATRRWGKTLGYVLARAEARVAAIEKARGGR